MPYGFIAGASVLGAGLEANAAGEAADTQRRGAQDASRVSQNQFDQLRQDQLPFINSGYGANQLLSRLLGINTARGNGPGGTGAPLIRNFNAGNGRLVGDKYLPPDVDVKPTGKKGVFEVSYQGQYLGYLKPGGGNGKFVQENDLPESAYGQLNPGSQGGQPEGMEGQPGQSNQPGAGYLTQLFGPEQFRQNVDPGYQFRLQQGTQGILNGAASRTGALSGPALRSLVDYNQAAGSQEYGAAFDRFQTQQGNIYQRLLGLTGLGQSAAAGVGQQGVNTAGQIGANITGAANAGAAGQIGQANAYAGALGDLGSLALLRNRAM